MHMYIPYAITVVNSQKKCTKATIQVGIRLPLKT